MDENRTLLIVDDEPETLKGYTEFLAPASEQGARKSSRVQATAQGSANVSQPKESYRILTAETGEKALEIAKAELAADRRIAAGFFDVKLGAGMDGLATIQAIRALDPEIHCVVVTAYHDRTVEEINKLFGEEFKDQWDYLNKPFTQGEIVQKARQMVAAWNRKRQLELLHQQLIRSERLAAIGQVARGVGHEFGNILLRIIGKTDLALMEKKDIAKIHDHLQVAMGAAERAGVIVRNLQSFSKSQPNFAVTQLSAPLEDALTLVNHELVKASVKLEKKFESVPAARIDTGGMGQVFLNLLVNAIHAMPGGGKLTVTVEPMVHPEKGDGVAANVADSGTGISPEILPRIFEYAFTTKGDRGSGLGLAISKEIVESHGGVLLVQTEPGKGSKFTVWVPLQKARTI